MDDAAMGGGVWWRRSGRLRLRTLTRADLGLLGGQEAVGRSLRVFEAWPQAEVVRALMQRYPSFQMALEIDQQLIGGLLALPEAVGPGPVLQPWSSRALSNYPASVGEDGLGAAGATSGETLRGVGALCSTDVSDALFERALQVGRQLWVQQLGCAATFSVVRAAGWEGFAERLSPTAYLQQVHARAVEDARLSVYLEAGYMMRGYWTVGEAIEVLMSWEYRAH